MKTIEALEQVAEDRSENTDLPLTQRPVRVCFLIDRLATAGTESQLVALIRHVDRSRIEPYLVLLDGNDDVSRTLEPVGCPTVRLGIKKLTSLRTLGEARRVSEVPQGAADRRATALFRG